jgi:hypothetical protein
MPFTGDIFSNIRAICFASGKSNEMLDSAFSRAIISIPSIHPHSRSKQPKVIQKSGCCPAAKRFFSTGRLYESSPSSAAPRLGGTVSSNLAVSYSLGPTPLIRAVPLNSVFTRYLFSFAQRVVGLRCRNLAALT